MKRLDFINFLACVFAVAISHVAFALEIFDSCSYVRLDSPGQSMEHVETRTQNLGDCYAEATAGMIDAFRFTHGDHDFNRPTFAEFLAVNYKQAMNSQMGLSDGDVRNALYVAGNSGICTPDESDSSLDKAKEGVHSYARMLSQLESLYLDVNGVKTVTEGKSEKDRNAFFHEQMTRVYCSVPRTEVSQLFPDLKVLEQAFAEDNETQMANLAFEKLCKQAKRTVSFDQVHKDYAWGTPAKNKQNDIDTLLNKKNPQPIAISFASDVFDEGKKYTPKLDESMDPPSVAMDHSALLIGRRRGKNGQCQYLVRNSSGNLCGSKEEKFHDWTCFDGNIWIDADTLSSSIAMIEWLK